MLLVSLPGMEYFFFQCQKDAKLLVVQIGLDFTFAQFHEAMCRTKNIDTEAVGAIASTVSALRMGKNAFWQDLRDDGASQKDQLIRAQGESWVRQKSKDLVDSLGGLNQVTLTSLSLYQEIFPSYPDFIPK